MKLNFRLFLLMLGFTGLLLAQGSTQMSDSPRPQQWIDFKRDNGTILKAFVVYPESKGPTKAVILIHDNKGLIDWVKAFSGKLADQGFLVIAPDLISNTVDSIAKTTDFENSAEVLKALNALDPEQVTRDLDIVTAHVMNDPSSNGEVAVIGFGWGGSQGFNYAAHNPNLEETMVFYGTAPMGLPIIRNINAPIYGFYGAADYRINATIPDTENIMKANGLVYTFDIYEGAGHSFMQQGIIEAYGPNTMAYEKAWKKLLSLLR